jgi:hypothetical protein
VTRSGQSRLSFAKALCKAGGEKVECKWRRWNRHLFPSTPSRSTALLTEQEVSRSWRLIFTAGAIAPEAFDRAEQLLDELRPESPLRHRLTIELDELRVIHTPRPAVARQKA